MYRIIPRGLFAVVQPAFMVTLVTPLLTVLLLCLIGWVGSVLAGISLLHALGLGALPLSILLGMMVVNLLPQAARLTAHAGSQRVLALVQKHALRIGIVLFGFNLTWQDITAVGWAALLTDVAVISLILVFGLWFGVKRLGMAVPLVVLVSIGSAVCGAAAVMGAAPLLRRQDEQVGVAVALVALFGTLSVILYPWLFELFGLTAPLFGLYVGSTVHEVAQVVAIGQGIGTEVMQTAVVVKLLRVMLLAPVLMVLGWWLPRYAPEACQKPEHDKAGVPLPGFVLGFVLVVVINSVLVIPAEWLQGLRELAMVLMTLAMVALGLNTRWAAIRSVGRGPLVLALLLWCLLLAGGAGLVIIQAG
jgi:uncharacterized integral membrane protein (TIGR00698 family)